MQFRYPRVGVSKANGLSVSITDDGLGHGHFGYRRILCSVASKTPITTDTEIKVRLSLSLRKYDSEISTVEQSLVMPAGTTSAMLKLRIPQTTDWRFVWWDVIVDGDRDPELSCIKDRSESFNSMVDSRWEDQQMLFLDVPRSGEQYGSSFMNVITIGVDHYSVRGDFSNNWLDYTPYDVVKMSVTQLADLSRNEPEKMAALNKWIRAGGMIWLTDAGNQWQHLPQVHKSFGWPEADSVDPTKPERKTPISELEWQYMILNQVVDQDQADGLQQDYSADQQSRDQALRVAATQPPIYSVGWIVERRCGWGSVVAFAAQPGSVPRNELWNYQDNLSRQFYARSWQRRHGLMPGYSNVDFSDWLIPGVGLAPVISFQVLITLFVIGIGPLNYWLLRRAGRLHLMVITVPGAALLVTGSLLAYGFLADGFGTRVRVQSITLVDQAKSHGATWNRLSYYAAFAPSNGLSFSDKTAVYAIEPGNNDSFPRPQLQGQRRIEWDDGKQKLASGWLGSRTPTQYLTLEPREVTAKLLVSLGSDLIARSTYQNPAHLVLVHGDDRQWYLAEDTPVDESFKLAAIEREEATAKLRKFLSENQPEKPLGLDSVNNAPFLRTNDWRYYHRNKLQSIDSAASISLLAKRWKELPDLDLPPRSYVLVADEALLPFAVDSNAVEDSSVHIVVGTW